MAQFSMKVAGQVAAVTSRFESTRDYCRNYLTEEAADFAVVVMPEDLIFEQRMLDEEAKEEGLRQRKFTDPFLERAAIQRKYAEHLFGCDTLLFHGSAVAVDGEGYLFTAKCGTGKSTHTRLWRQAFGSRAVMVNDDKPFLRITQEGVQLCGAPWSGKHGLDANMTVPLKGICILERGAENRIRRVEPETVLAMLRKQTCAPLEEEKQGRFLELVDILAKTVPLWRMECNPQEEAALVSHRAMSAETE